jgi:excinuclease ABC subunit C
VEDFLDTRGESLKRQISAERDRASEALAFEEAASLHTRLEKLAPVLQQMPETVQRIDRMCALIVQASAMSESVALFRVDAGIMAGPLAFPVSSPEHAKSQSMEARIQEVLSSCPPSEPRSTIERMEHLAILKRWCYRGTRKGEIFVANVKGQLPMRQIVRGIGRVYKGENPEAATAPPEPPPKIS